MNNIFKKVKKGDQFVTSDGNYAEYMYRDKNIHVLRICGHDYGFNSDGTPHFGERDKIKCRIEDWEDWV